MSKKMHFWQKSFGSQRRNQVTKFFEIWAPSVIHVNLGNLSKASSKTPGNLQILDFRGCFCQVKIFFYFSKYWPWNRGEQFPSTHILHRSLHFPKIQNAFNFLLQRTMAFVFVRSVTCVVTQCFLLYVAWHIKYQLLMQLGGHI